MSHNPIPAVSLHQPYVSLIAARVKPWETRDYPPPMRLLGQRIAIHAAKKKPQRGELRADVEAAISVGLGMDDWFGEVLPLGAVVCTAILGGAVRVRAPADHNDMAEFDRILTKDGAGGTIGRLAIKIDLFGDYRPGRWCWEMTDIQVLPEPVPARGYQVIGWPWVPPVDFAA